ncbi:hypothetical protein HXX76_013391 [Chlamydomonas incerta]|uniref:Glycerophosphocholine acyltransferase 1 n=1 Tax=Chlamydomonas incerta TaxID=51695 RepID=A0A835SSB4_CHLIN|nr:hypothetical protein HXX76_013391 [Chlamydomonas incerta]|eukprot:KAG2425765.1 hypothetical protein HXX76_013391 [Chlamydomonas incerta]
MADSKSQDSGNRYDVHAHAGTASGTPTEPLKDSSPVDVVGTLNAIARQQGAHGASLRYFGGCLVLAGLVALLCFAPALVPLAFLGFVATCLPYRVWSFTRRKWVFFLVDYCYFANLAAAAFLVWAPTHAGWEAAVYASCEGPLAGALVAWQCAWVMGSPDHIITVLMHSLPGLALFAHRHLAHTRQPLQLAAALAAALTGPAATVPTVEAPGPGASSGMGRYTSEVTYQQQQEYGSGGGDGLGAAAAAAAAAAVGATAAGAGAHATAAGAGAGLLRRLVAAADVARGRVPCGAGAVRSWAGQATGAVAGVCNAAADSPVAYTTTAFSSASSAASASASRAVAAASSSAGAAAAAFSTSRAAAAAGAGAAAAAAGSAFEPAPTADAAASCSGGLAAAATVGAGAGPALCYAAPLPPAACPAPAWLWLAAAPLLFYLAWQLLYFVVVQVCYRRLILARGYDTSYRSLARRAQRSRSALNRVVRRGGVARRLILFGLLQFVFTLATLALAVVTYHSYGAAVAWQVVKFLLPMYLGAVHTCERAPTQELRAAAAQMAAAGLLAAPAAEALRAEAAGKQQRLEGQGQGQAAVKGPVGK